MESTELGKRLKEARLAKKLTQAEVVGTFITRNMLSQIESGSAMPSVKTLQYLCEKLEIPISSLDQQEEPPRADDRSDYIRLREAYKNGDYETVAAAESCEGYEDEFAALRARALLALCDRADSQDAASLQHAADLAKKASAAAGEGLFANESLRTEAMLKFNSIVLKLSDYYKNMIDSELAVTIGKN